MTIMDNDHNFNITKVYITIHNAIDGLSEVVSSSVFSSIIPPSTVNNVTALISLLSMFRPPCHLCYCECYRLHTMLEKRN